MIQRIQTIYLLVVVVLAALGCAMPLVDFDNGLQQLTLSAWQMSSAMPGALTQSAHFWGLFAMSLVIPVLAFVTIFLYRKRMLQIRLCIFNILLMVGYYAVLGVCVWQTVSKFNADFRPQLAALFPLIEIILTWLAIRGIGKDEAKVRAADRLR
jgi:hypothetical protein